jgi:hypothetical protein
MKVVHWEQAGLRPNVHWSGLTNCLTLAHKDLCIVTCVVSEVMKYVMVSAFSVLTLPIRDDIRLTQVYFLSFIHLFSIPYIRRGGYRTCHYNNNKHNTE